MERPDLDRLEQIIADGCLPWEGSPQEEELARALPYLLEKTRKYETLEAVGPELVEIGSAMAVDKALYGFCVVERQDPTKYVFDADGTIRLKTEDCKFGQPHYGLHGDRAREILESRGIAVTLNPETDEWSTADGFSMNIGGIIGFRGERVDTENDLYKYLAQISIDRPLPTLAAVDMPETPRVLAEKEMAHLQHAHPLAAMLFSGTALTPGHARALARVEAGESLLRRIIEDDVFSDARTGLRHTTPSRADTHLDLHIAITAHLALTEAPR